MTRGLGAAIAVLVLAAAPGVQAAGAPGAEALPARAASVRSAAHVFAAGAARAGDARMGRPARRRCRAVRRRRCARLRWLRRAFATERLTPVISQPGPSPGAGTGTTTPGPPSADPGPAPSPSPLPRFVSVSAREFFFTLSRPFVGAGSVTVELRNVGEDPHNLVVSPDDGSHTQLDAFPETGPGGVARRTVTLDPGRYRLWCSLDGHEEAGMSARLEVR